MRRLALCLLVGTVAVVLVSCDGNDDAEPPPPPPTTATTPAPEPPALHRRGIVLDLGVARARPGDTLQLTIENTTRLRFEFGVAYRLERRVGGRWRWMNPDSAFILILKFIEPGGREREEIRLPRDLEPGRYRIVKSFSAPAANRKVRATVEFAVR